MNEYTGTPNLEVMAEAINYNKYLINLVASQTRQGEDIVDFGAGIGTFAKALVLQGYSVRCVEPDLYQAALIRESGLEVFTDLNQIEDNSIDFLYMLNVLEHIENDYLLLQNLHRKLKIGGKLLIYVPAFQLLFSKMDEKVGHYRRYNKNNLKEIVLRANFQVIRSQYADSLGFLATILYKVIGDDSGEINLRALITYDRLIFPISRMLDKMFSPFFGKNVLLIGIKKN